MEAQLSLIIMSPEQVLEQCEITYVKLPGKVAPFEVLKGHAPMITTLNSGKLTYQTAGGEVKSLSVKSGFVEIRNNKVSVCVEL